MVEDKFCHILCECWTFILTLYWQILWATNNTMALYKTMLQPEDLIFSALSGLWGYEKMFFIKPPLATAREA